MGKEKKFWWRQRRQKIRKTFTLANDVNGWIWTFGSHCSGFLAGGSNTLYATWTNRCGVFWGSAGCPSLSGGGIADHQFDGMTTSATQTPSSPSGMQRPFNGDLLFIETWRRTQIFCRCKCPPGSAPAWNRTRSTGESRGIVERTKCAEISRWRFDCCWRSSSAWVAFCDVVTAGCELSVVASEISGTMYLAGTVCLVENGP